MPVDVASVSYVLSSMASVGKILEAVISLSKKGLSPTSSEFHEIELQAKTVINKRLENGAYANTRLASSMSGQVIATLRSEMDRIMKRITDAISDPRLSASDKMTVATREQEEYCKNLQIVKQFNGGKLPTDLEEEWKNNDCDRF